jgi:hypothetical protein
LRFHLPNGAHDLLPDAIRPPQSADVCASKVRRFGLILDQESLCANAWRDRYNENENDDDGGGRVPVVLYSRKLTERLHKLRHLDLVIESGLIRDDWSRNYGYPKGSYANLIESFLSTSIETLTIDTTLLNDQDIEIHESDEWNYWRYECGANERCMRWTRSCIRLPH